ncbi:MAG TPA: ABC transporter substrate-binding protein [Burkholderiales bacterium]|nr:ABC transporter substrate-binding protein [Burkholderiales bacterium]
METPTEPGWFRMDLASGKLTPLEKIKPVMEGSRYSYRVYLPGLQSTAVVPYEPKPLFAIRLTTLWGKAPTLEEERKSQAKLPERLEWLQPAKNGRYATKQYVPLELVATYGDVATLPVRGPKRETRTFVFAPQTALSPGNYAFTVVGLLTPGDSGPMLGEVHAFTVSVAAPTHSMAPVSSRSMQLIVPFAIGGGADQVARIFLSGLAEASPSMAYVANFPGEGGAVGKSMIASAKPDGLTLGIVAGNESNTNLARGLTPISILVRGGGDRVPAGYWQALVGPPGMDEQLVQAINRDAVAALGKVRDKLSGLGLVVVGSSAADFTSFVAAGGGRLPGATALEPSLEVRIGHVAPLTGGLAHLGKDNENGARLAIEQANAAQIRIGGKVARFVLFAEDDQGTGQGAVAAAQRLVAAKVVGVVGHLSSGASIAASAIYRAAGVPVISPSATNPMLTEMGSGVQFRVIGRDDQQGPAIANYLRGTSRAKLVAVIDDSTAYGAGVADGVEATLKSHSIEVLPREKGAGTTVDWRPALARIQAKNPDAVFFGGMDSSAAPLIRQARELGIKAPFLAADGACVDSMSTLSGGAAEGMVCIQPGLPISVAARKFVDAYQARFSRAPILYAPFAYDATNALIEAIKKADSAEPLRYQSQLAQLSFTGATGLIAFDEKGDRKYAPMTIDTLKGGTLAPIAVMAGVEQWTPLATLPARAGPANHPQVDLRTSLGVIRLELYPDVAPKTVDNFLQYVREGYYNGTLFHRVINGFMIQGGGYDSDFRQKTTHDPIANEAQASAMGGLQNELGTIAMARTANPDSATAQFFININNNSSLNWNAARGDGNGYAVFGRVVSGLDIVNQIAKTPTGAGGPFPRDVPNPHVLIESATMVTGGT